MTREERNAYCRGYVAGKRGYWPVGDPLLPPDAVTQRIVKALAALWNEVDMLRATGCFEDDDRIIPAFDEAEEALAAIRQAAPQQGEGK